MSGGASDGVRTQRQFSTAHPSAWRSGAACSAPLCALSRLCFCRLSTDAFPVATDEELTRRSGGHVEEGWSGEEKICRTAAEQRSEERRGETAAVAVAPSPVALSVLARCSHARSFVRLQSSTQVVAASSSPLATQLRAICGVASLSPRADRCREADEGRR